MPLSETIEKWVPWLGPAKSKLSRAESLALRPIRNPIATWKEKQAGTAPLILEVPRRDDVLGRAISAVFQITGTKTIELDEFGSEIWLLCDGTKRVQQLVAYTCQKYRMNERQAEVSVVAFMRMLSSRRLIGFVEEDKSHGSSRETGTDRQPKSRRQRRGRRH